MFMVLIYTMSGKH